MKIVWCKNPAYDGHQSLSKHLLNIYYKPGAVLLLRE